MTLIQKKHGQQSFKQVGVILISFLCALFVGALLLLLAGEDPFEIYHYLFIKPLTSWSGVIKVLAKVTPLIFAGLAVAMAFKCNVFNIGVEGQLYIGGLTAAVLGNCVQGLPGWLHVTVCVIGAMAVGAFFAWIPAILKVKLNVHEVISTIMLNYIIAALISLFVVQYFRYDGPVAGASAGGTCGNGPGQY